MFTLKRLRSSDSPPGHQRHSPRRQQLWWLLVGRILTVTILVLTTAIVHFTVAESILVRSLIPLYVLVALSYMITLLSAAWLKITRNERPVALLQIVFDVLLVTGLISATGGIDSIFTFLYLLTIINASILLGRQGAWLAGALSVIAHSALLISDYYQIILPFGLGSIDRDYTLQFLLRNVAWQGAAFLAVGFLSGRLADQLRTTGEALRVKERDFDTLVNFHRTILENLPTGVMTVDPLFHVTSVNDAARRFLKIDDGYLSWEQVVRMVRELPEKLNQTLAGGEAVVWEGKIAEQPLRTYNLTASLLRDVERHDLGYVVILQDVTRLKEMEDHLRREDRLAAIGRVSTGIAHELRNPLASICGSIALLRESFQPTDDENKRLCDIIADEAARLNHLVADFLSFVKPTRPKYETVDIGLLVANVVGAINRMPAMHADIRVQSVVSESLEILADRHQVSQIFWNLLRNAIEALPDGSGRIEIQLADTPRAVSALVSDNGVGMSQEQIDRAFEPFFSTKTEGTGLGLALVFKILEEHRGQIRLTSQVGNGTTVAVTLPRQPIDE